MVGQNWAITVGINNYRNLQALQFAKQDAESMQQYLGDELGCRLVYHFSDDSPPIPQDYGPPLDSQPTFATLRRFLRVRFEQPFLKAGDNLWFFFAGHGIRHEDRDYLMPIDGDPGDIESTAIPLHYVTERLQRCGADNVILLVDACRSSSGRRDGLGIGQERQPGVITIFSCSPKESSYEIEELGHGAFTYALSEGFKLQGGNNCATVERLDQYLHYQVPSLNSQYSKPTQTPYTAVEPLSKNHLILLPQKATLQDVLALKADAQEAELENELDLAEQLWIRVLAASTADRQAITALQRIALKRVSRTDSPGPTAAPIAGSRSVTAPTYEQPPPFISPPLTFEFEVVKINAHGQVCQRKQRSAKYHQEDLGQGISLDLVLIPGGTFMMGSPAGEAGRDWYGYFDDALRGENVEGPQHQAKIQHFLMGKYPVTQAQWNAVATLPKVEHDLNADPANFKGDNLPVEQVSWDDAVEFCQRLSKETGRKYRLPSEAEWEYACRAGMATPFHFGATITTDLANYNGNDGMEDGQYPGFYGQWQRGEYRKRTTEVGYFSANGFGLYDMHGNVWEWCLDNWHRTHDGAPIDGSAWLSFDGDNLGLLRGGSWSSDPWFCRSAVREEVTRDHCSSRIGFRVVCAFS